MAGVPDRQDTKEPAFLLNFALRKGEDHENKNGNTIIG
jgi:hypothetical protein